MRPGDPVIEIKGKKLRESAKAIQFEFSQANGVCLDQARVEWFPFSQISKISEDSLIVSVWIMGEKGLSTDVLNKIAQQNQRPVLSDVAWNEEDKDFSDLEDEDDIPF